jgi:carboxymethylenebutenolidase
MKTQFTDIKTQTGICDSFIAYPSDDATYPAVLFFMDGFGPRAQLYEMAKHLASQGYYVLLPNLLYRVSRAPVIDAQFPITPETMPAAIEQLMPLVKRFDPEGALKDISAFLDFLSAQKQVYPGKMGITGYCMGGGMAIRAAASYPGRFAAVASFHGGNLATETPSSPHLLAKNIKAELYIAHADQDRNMPPEQMERLRSALDTAKVQYEAELYAGAPHGFTMADLPAYRKEASDRHWEKLLALLGRKLSP